METGGVTETRGRDRFISQSDTLKYCWLKYTRDNFISHTKILKCVHFIWFGGVWFQVHARYHKNILYMESHSVCWTENRTTTLRDIDFDLKLYTIAVWNVQKFK